MNIVCVGDCGIDLYLPSGERRVGGITANVARFARQVFPDDDVISIVSCVGDDDAGARVRSLLAGTGIDCRITTRPGMTPVQTIEIAADGEKKFLRYEEGVLREFRPDVAQEAVIAAADLVVAPVYRQVVGLYEALMSIPCRGQTAIDFADFLEHPDFGLLDPYIDRIDIGFFGLAAAETGLVEAIERRALDHDRLFVVTLGPDGSLAFDGDRRFECPAAPVSKVIDTTGAGDAFAAGFLSRRRRGAGIQDSMEFGALLAARVVARLGAQAGNEESVEKR